MRVVRCTWLHRWEFPLFPFSDLVFLNGSSHLARATELLSAGTSGAARVAIAVFIQNLIV